MKWIKCSERMPTKEDFDSQGEIAVRWKDENNKWERYEWDNIHPIKDQIPFLHPEENPVDVEWLDEDPPSKPKTKITKEDLEALKGKITFLANAISQAEGFIVIDNSCVTEIFDVED